MAQKMDEDEMVIPRGLGARWLAAATTGGGSTVLHGLASMSSGETSTEALVSFIRRLVSAGLGLERRDADGNTPFLCAALHNGAAVMDALARAGADVGARGSAGGYTAVHAAVATGSVSALAFLLDSPLVGGWRDADTPLWRLADDEEMTPLHHCATATAVSVRRWSASFLFQPAHVRAFPPDATVCRMAEMLLCRDPRLPVDATNMRRRTALMETESPGLAAVLLRWGADVRLHDDSGATAAHWAAYRGHTDLLRLLVAGGADVESTDVRGLTVLHEACMYNRAEAVRYLVREAGADVSRHTAHTGFTPLHYAMGFNGPPAVDVVLDLLEAGARLSATAQHGYTAMDVGTDPMVLLAMEWAPLREDVLQVAVDVAAHVPPDLAALVVGYRCAAAAVQDMPCHMEITHDIRARRAAAAAQRKIAIAEDDDLGGIGARVAKRRRANHHC